MSDSPNSADLATLGVWVLGIFGLLAGLLSEILEFLGQKRSSVGRVPTPLLVFLVVSDALVLLVYSDLEPDSTAFCVAHFSALTAWAALSYWNDLRCRPGSRP